MSCKSSRSHQEIVQKLLDEKAVDFDSIGRVVAEVGPIRALADEPWEEFCGTMRIFVRVYKLPPIFTPSEVENLSALNTVSNEIQR